MSLYNYFSKLGTINYNGTLVDNIISNVRFKEAIRANISIFYPYTIKEGERADTIASDYYQDERYAWVVYLSNYIMDPYYEWPLSLEEFNSFIIKKYGSKENSLNLIAFYRNNWYKDDTILSPSGYESLPGYRKKYWNPIIGYNGKIVSYERKKNDLIVETNKIINIYVSNTAGFSLNENVAQKTSGVITGEGTVKNIVSNNVIVVASINGQFSNTSGSVGTLQGKYSNISRPISNVITISTPISNDESIYWEPVPYYDYENELNESRKNIKLIDRQYLTVIEDQMIELLS